MLRNWCYLGLSLKCGHNLDKMSFVHWGVRQELPVLWNSLCRPLSGIERNRFFSCGLGWGHKILQAEVVEPQLHSWTGFIQGCMDLISLEPISEGNEDFSFGSCVQTESEQGSEAPTSGKLTLMCQSAGVCRLLLALMQCWHSAWVFTCVSVERCEKLACLNYFMSWGGRPYSGLL